MNNNQTTQINKYQTKQPSKYTKEELQKLRQFIQTVKNDETRCALACWGNYSEYNKGW